MLEGYGERDGGKGRIIIKKIEVFVYVYSTVSCRLQLSEPDKKRYTF
jgi:hypothetical protein